MKELLIAYILEHDEYCRYPDWFLNTLTSEELIKALDKVVIDLQRKNYV